MAEYVFAPSNVCSRKMTIEYEGDVIKGLSVEGGCHGNLQGIGKLLEGMKIDDAIDRLSGIVCRGSRNRMTSCPDQISIALREIKEMNK